MAAAEGEEKGSQWRVVVRTLDGDDGDQGDASSGGVERKEAERAQCSQWLRRVHRSRCR